MTRKKFPLKPLGSSSRPNLWVGAGSLILMVCISLFGFQACTPSSVSNPSQGGNNTENRSNENTSTTFEGISDTICVSLGLIGDNDGDGNCDLDENDGDPENCDENPECEPFRNNPYRSPPVDPEKPPICQDENRNVKKACVIWPIVGVVGTIAAIKYSKFIEWPVRKNRNVTNNRKIEIPDVAPEQYVSAIGTVDKNGNGPQFESRSLNIWPAAADYENITSLRVSSSSVANNVSLHINNKDTPNFHVGKKVAYRCDNFFITWSSQNSTFQNTVDVRSNIPNIVGGTTVNLVKPKTASYPAKFARRSSELQLNEQAVYSYYQLQPLCEEMSLTANPLLA